MPPPALPAPRHCAACRVALAPGAHMATTGHNRPARARSTARHLPATVSIATRRQRLRLVLDTLAGKIAWTFGVARLFWDEGRARPAGMPRQTFAIQAQIGSQA